MRRLAGHRQRAHRSPFSASSSNPQPSAASRQLSPPAQRVNTLLEHCKRLEADLIKERAEREKLAATIEGAVEAKLKATIDGLIEAKLKSLKSHPPPTENVESGKESGAQPSPELSARAGDKRKADPEWDTSSTPNQKRKLEGMEAKVRAVEDKLEEIAQDAKNTGLDIEVVKCNYQAMQTLVRQPKPPCSYLQIFFLLTVTFITAHQHRHATDPSKTSRSTRAGPGSCASLDLVQYLRVWNAEGFSHSRHHDGAPL
jgi:hypothetical protein